ncbi:hypothetical protein HNR73_003529 [Phytomonospora endophytica]|uniref:Uncharacterized protein n=1 Tax=Phytomonospora endophytica TaxID=714109 RepID=A0A841FIQ2_9ACTN|nr:hypothetical protein [Phytomonospora endophytica]
MRSCALGLVADVRRTALPAARRAVVSQVRSDAPRLSRHPDPLRSRSRAGPPLASASQRPHRSRRAGEPRFTRHIAAPRTRHPPLKRTACTPHDASAHRRVRASDCTSRRARAGEAAPPSPLRRRLARLRDVRLAVTLASLTRSARPRRSGRRGHRPHSPSRAGGGQAVLPAHIARRGPRLPPVEALTPASPANSPVTASRTHTPSRGPPPANRTHPPPRHIPDTPFPSPPPPVSLYFLLDN